MNKTITTFIITVLAAPFAFAGYTIDGDLSDWGVQPFNTWTPGSPTADRVVANNDDTYNVYPGDYSEPYDMEALYFDDDEDNIYIAVVTSYQARDIGDIFLDLNGDMSVAAHGQATGFDAAIRLGSSGGVKDSLGPQTILSEVLTKDGTTELGNNTYHRTAPNAWQYQGSPYQIVSGILQPGLATIAYRDWDFSVQDPYETDTRIFEISVAKNLLNDPNAGDTIGIHLTMYCGNDSINLIGDLDFDAPVPVVPVPSAALLTGFGALIVNRFRKHRHSYSLRNA